MSDSLVIHSFLRDYTVYFNTDVKDIIANIDCDRDYFVVDANVFKLYRDIFSALPEGKTFILDPAEENKTLDTCKKVIEFLVERRFRRDNVLVAAGGGIIQDITAFTASVLYRGVNWKFIPTTLLAQADSCIGGKTSINLGQKKNLIGNFYPPEAVHIGTQFLDTLMEADIKSGIGEMLHFYVYAGSDFLQRTIDNYTVLIAERASLLDYIRASLSIKKDVIESDEQDKGERNKFNYGHTFGHALETVTRYEINHGQAVTVGMDLANYIAKQLGIQSATVYEQLHRQMGVNKPSYDFRRIDVDAYLGALSKDKKNVENDLVCILAEKPGKLLKHRMKMDGELRSMVQTYYQKECLE